MTHDMHSFHTDALLLHNTAALRLPLHFSHTYRLFVSLTTTVSHPFYLNVTTTAHSTVPPWNRLLQCFIETTVSLTCRVVVSRGILVHNTNDRSPITSDRNNFRPAKAGCVHICESIGIVPTPQCVWVGIKCADENAVCASGETCLFSL